MGELKYYVASHPATDLLDENNRLRNRILRLRLALLDLSEHRWWHLECKTRKMAMDALIRDENEGYNRG